MTLTEALERLQHEYGAAGDPVSDALADFCSRLIALATPQADTAAPTVALTGDSLMPWGKHRGVQMKRVPADYLLWLRTSAGGCRDKAVASYIEANLAEITVQAGKPRPVASPTPTSKAPPF